MFLSYHPEKSLPQTKQTVKYQCSAPLLHMCPHVVEIATSDAITPEEVQHPPQRAELVPGETINQCKPPLPSRPRPSSRKASARRKGEHASRGACLLCASPVLVNQRRVKANDGYMHEACAEQSNSDHDVRTIVEDQTRSGNLVQQPVDADTTNTIHSQESESTCAYAHCDNSASGQCKRCKQVYYCCREHQVADWKAHKAICFATAEYRTEKVRERAQHEPPASLVRQGSTCSDISMATISLSTNCSSRSSTRLQRTYSNLLSAEAGLPIDILREALSQEGREPSAKRRILSTAQRIWNSRQQRHHANAEFDQTLFRRTYSDICAEEAGVPIEVVQEVLSKEGRDESAKPRVLSAAQRIWNLRVLMDNSSKRRESNSEDLEQNLDSVLPEQHRQMSRTAYQSVTMADRQRLPRSP